MTETTTVRTPLDDTREFFDYFVVARPTQLDVMAAWAAHTHGLRYFYTTPRLLIWGDEPECGKTESESLVLRLSANPWTLNKETTKDSLRSKFDVPDQRMVPTIGIQEVTDIFGMSGRNGTSHPANTYLRLGYKRGEKTSVSRSGTSVDIDIYNATVMAGLKNAVPKDIRTRCVCIQMKQGTPQMEYVGIENDPMADALAAALGNWVRQHGDFLGRFRARGLHPKLKGRKREIWEALFAVAAAAGGTWPRRMLAAFLDLAIDQAETVPLTPQQIILRDMLRGGEVIGSPRVGGLELMEEMRRFGEPMYEALTRTSMSMFMSKAMEPVNPVQFRLNGDVVRGYSMHDIRRIAAERLPLEVEEDGDDERDGDEASARLASIFDPQPDGEIEDDDVTAVTAVTASPAVMA